jgi:ribose transport system permease protein
MLPTKKPPRELPTLILLLIVCLGMTLTVPAFHTASNLTVVGQNAAFIGVMACGEGIVILAGGLDLSVGSILALSSCVTAAALTAEWAWPLAALLGLGAGALAGAINGLLITYRQIPPILTTLATLLLFRHGVSIATQAKNYGPFSDAFDRIGAGWTPTLILALVVILAMAITLRGRFGRWILAVGGNEQAARLSAVPVNAVKRRAYLISGLCAGLAGLITMAFNNNAQSSVGQGYELDVIAACVVGGVRITGGDGTVLGAALGAFLIALLRDVFVLTNRPIAQYGLITGVVILAAAGLEQWRVHREEGKGKREK